MQKVMENNGGESSSSARLSGSGMPDVTKSPEANATTTPINIRGEDKVQLVHNSRSLLQPSQTSPPACVVEIPDFQTYADYERYLVSTSPYPLQPQKLDTVSAWKENPGEDLWLIQFQTGERGVRTYRYQHESPPPKESSTLKIRDSEHEIGCHSSANSSPPTEGAAYNGPNDHEIVTSPESFRRHLGGFDTNVEYQLIIFALGEYNRPRNWAVDLLGLGLDMGPEIWNYVGRRQVRSYQRETYDPDKMEPFRLAPDPGTFPWIDKSDIIDVGGNAVAILETLPKRRPKTALIFLGNMLSLERLRTTGVGYASGWPLGLPLAILNRSPQPSQPTWDGSIPPAPGEDLDTWVCRKLILAESNGSEAYGHGNGLFVCLKVLVRLHLARPSRNIPAFISKETAELKYIYGENHGLRTDTRFLWSRLKEEAEEQRLNLMALRPFVEQNFDNDNIQLTSELATLQAMYDIYVKEIELAEVRLKDHIGMFASQKSTEMAKISIAESKRVMLLTALAFVFLPVSLAASILGMNVQQINNTGHSIKTFVTTSIILVVSTLMLWATIAGLSGFRYRRLERMERESRGQDYVMSRIDSILHYGSWGMMKRTTRRLRWRYWLWKTRSRTEHKTTEAA